MIEKKPVVHGGAVVPVGNWYCDKQKKTISGWAIPGGSYTTSRIRAEKVAELINKEMKRSDQ